MPLTHTVYNIISNDNKLCSVIKR